MKCDKVYSIIMKPLHSNKSNEKTMLYKESICTYGVHSFNATICMKWIKHATQQRMTRIPLQPYLIRTKTRLHSLGLRKMPANCSHYSSEKNPYEKADWWKQHIEKWIVSLFMSSIQRQGVDEWSGKKNKHLSASKLMHTFMGLGSCPENILASYDRKGCFGGSGTAPKHSK